MLTKAQAGGRTPRRRHPASNARITCRPAIPRRCCTDELQGRHGRKPVAARPDAVAAISVRGRPAAGALRRLVRDGAAQPEQDPRPARHVQGLHRAAARHRGDGFRRALFHADPSDRQDQSQGPQQCGDGRAKAIPAAPTRSAPPKAATMPCIRNWARWRISAPSSRPAKSTAWRSRSTSPCNARRIIPGSSSIRNGSSAGRTARCAMRKIRRRNTRTSSIPISPREDAGALWNALRDVMLFWIDQGVKIFRVDNPHTKPLPVLGMADPRGSAPPSRRDLPRRSLYAAEADEGARQARLHPVLHLFHLAHPASGSWSNI